MERVKENSVFVGVWGYNQTNYSRFKVVRMSGKKTVYVEPIGSFSNLRENQLAVGSIVKIYESANWYNLSKEEQKDLTERGFSVINYNHNFAKERLEKAKEVEIVKTKKSKDGYSVNWELSDGTSYNTSNSKFDVKQIRPLKRCIVNTKYGDPSIKINDTVTAQLDENYESKKDKYVEGNMRALAYGH